MSVKIYLYALFEYFLCFSEELETIFANFCKSDSLALLKKYFIFSVSFHNWICLMSSLLNKS